MLQPWCWRWPNDVKPHEQGQGLSPEENKDEAWIALRLTLKVAGFATLINVFIGIGIAYVFARKHFWGKDVLDAVLTLPMVMPPTVLGYYLLVLIGRNGPIGQFLQTYLDINLIFTWQGAVIAAAIVSFPLVFKAARAAFESLEPQYEQAARVLGVGELAIFFRVTLPLAWRGILSGVLLSFARSSGEFGATLMVAGSIPGQTQTLSIAVYEAVQAGRDDVANFLVLLTSVVCITVLLVSGKLMPGRVIESR
jgi:molybdate transport system permease protein